jgi:hypothetical protein
LYAYKNYRNCGNMHHPYEENTCNDASCGRNNGGMTTPRRASGQSSNGKQSGSANDVSTMPFAPPKVGPSYRFKSRAILMAWVAAIVC